MLLQLAFTGTPLAATLDTFVEHGKCARTPRMSLVAPMRMTCGTSHNTLRHTPALHRRADALFVFNESGTGGLTVKF